MKCQTNLFEIAEIRSSRRLLLWMAVLFTILTLFGQSSARAQCNITISPSSLPAGTVGCSYSGVTFSASGGIAPYTFGVFGSPSTDGLSINSSSGVLSATALNGTGSFTIVVTARDTNNCTGYKTNTLTVNCPTTTLTPSPGALPSGTVGSPYSKPITASGGCTPYTFTWTGTLPPNLSLSTSASSATISGTPTTTGTYTFYLTATETNGCGTYSNQYSLTINCPTITLSPGTLPNGTEGVTYYQQLTASGSGAGLAFYGTTENNGSGSSVGTVFRVTPAGVLTTLVNFNGANGQYPWAGLVLGSDRNFYGTTQTGGNSGVGTVFKMTPAGVLTTLVNFTGANGSGPYAGLVLGSDGNFYGTTSYGGPNDLGTVFQMTPAGVLTTLVNFTGANGHGPYAGLVQGSDGNFYGTTVGGGANDLGTVFKMTPAGVLTTLVSFNGSSGAPLGAQPTAGLVQGTLYTFAVTSGSLPPGLTLSTNGTLSGTPAKTGGSCFTVTATDTNNCAGSTSYCITNNCAMITLAPGTLPNGTVGTTYTPQQLIASGGDGPYTFTIISGSLNGLQLSPSGSLGGTPTSSGPTCFTVQAADTNNCPGTRSYCITNNCPRITLSSPSLPSGTVGTPYGPQQISASGGSAPYTYAIIGGSPNGLTLSSSGSLRGTPNVSGPACFTVQATDSYNCSGTTNYCITINCPRITLSPSSLPNGTVGATYSPPLITASGGVAPYTYAMTPGSAGGLMLSTNGQLSGTPTNAVVCFTVTATDSNGCAGSTNYCLSNSCFFLRYTNITVYTCSNCAAAPFTNLVTDACCSNLSLYFNPSSNTCFGVNTTNLVQVVASDACGYTNIYDVTVMVLPGNCPTNSCTNNFAFSDFGSNSLAGSALQLNGNAAFTNGVEGTPVLRLTPASTDQAGSAFLPVRLGDNLSFSTEFSFQMTNGGGITDGTINPTGADGIVFVLAESPGLGGQGGGVGYSGLANSIGIKFDTFQDGTANDPNGNFVAIYTDGSVNTAGYVPYSPSNPSTEPQYFSPSTSMKNGDIWHVWIDYNGDTSELDVRLSDGVNTRPATPQLSQSISLNNLSILGPSPQLYAGLTSGTGQAYDDNDILSWQFRSPCTNACISVQCSNILVTTCSNCALVPLTAIVTDLCCTNADYTSFFNIDGEIGYGDPGYSVCFPVNTTNSIAVQAYDTCSTNSVWSYYTITVLPGNCSGPCTNGCIKFANAGNLLFSSCSGCVPVYYPLTAIDTCCTNGPVTLSFTPTNGTCFSLGTTQVSCTATDACGNCNSTNFTVTVIQATNPPVINCPSNIVVAGCGNTPVYYNPTANSAFCSNVTVVANPSSGFSFPPGTNTVNCYATDCCGLTNTCSFTVTVLCNGTNNPCACNGSGGTPAEQSFTTLYTFSPLGVNRQTNSDGAYPYAGLILSGNTLYGTTAEGGTNGSGTVFKVNADGTGFTTLYTFSEFLLGQNSDGAYPYAGLILSGNTLYGTAEVGGSGNVGTVFKVNTDGSGFTTLHSFTSGSEGDGAYPYAGLILSGHTLYGTTIAGASANNGTVFAVNTNGTGFTTLHTFTIAPAPNYENGDGANPAGGLMLSGNTLYGTAGNGGYYDNGTVFAVNTNGSGFKTLHSFAGNPNDGASPAAGLLLSGNTFYGTTGSGGSGGNSGTVFAINTDGSGYTILHNFGIGSGSAVDPVAGLILSGNRLYGTTQIGGALPHSFGTVFTINIDGTGYTILYTFSGGSDEGDPFAGLVLSGNTLYGTTEGGSGYGTVFALALTNSAANCLQIECPSNIVVTSCTSIQEFYAPTVTDLSCSSRTVVCTPPSGTYFAPNTTNLVNCVVTDCCGLSNSCSFTVTVLPGPGSVAIAHQQQGNNVILTWSDGFLQSSPTLYGVGDPRNLRTPWSDVSGAVSPYITGAVGASTFYRLRCPCLTCSNCLVLSCPTNITVTTCAACTNIPFASYVGVTDNCCTNWHLTFNYPTNFCFPVNTTNTVEVTATDTCGDIANNSFQVIVLSCGSTTTNCLSLSCPGNIYVGTCSNTPARVNGSATMLGCTNGVSLLYIAVPPGTYSYDLSTIPFPVGSNEVTVYALQGETNTLATCSFLVIVTNLNCTGSGAVVQWTFGVSQPEATVGAGVTLSNIAPELGSGSALAYHQGAATYLSPVGNGSDHSLGANNWAVGDYFEFACPTVNAGGIGVAWDQVSSATGPGLFQLQYSTDGVNFYNFGPAYAVAANGSLSGPVSHWSSETNNSTTRYEQDLSSISGLANAAQVWFRLLDVSSNNPSGGPVGSYGTSRVGNFTVYGGSLAGTGGIPEVTWADPAPITYGTPLGAAQLNAMASVPGTFTYSPLVGTILSVGSNLLFASFTPTSGGYGTTGIVSQLVLPRILTVSADNATRRVGETNPVFTGTILGALNSDNVSVTWTSSATPSSPPGEYPITPVVTANPGALGNYGIIVHNPGTTTVTSNNCNCSGMLNLWWTFEVSRPSGNEAAGVPITGIHPEYGSGMASAWHQGATVYSHPSGNGSTNAFIANNWAVGDYFQFACSNVSLCIDWSVSWDQVSSPTGPGQFQLQYSFDGMYFNNFGQPHQVYVNGQLQGPSPAWNYTTFNPKTHYIQNLSSISENMGVQTVWFRLMSTNLTSAMSTSLTSADGHKVGPSGTSRVDNFKLTSTLVNP